MASAQIALAGMDPLQFLKTTDELERALMLHIAKEYYELLSKLDQSRANMIANAVGRLFKK
jgi:hypothetical protein